MDRFEQDLVNMLNRLDEKETETLLEGVSFPKMNARIKRRLKKQLSRAHNGQAAQKRRRLHWLIPVAACAILAIALFSIPSVSEAISNWLISLVRVQRYFYDRKEDRTPNVDIEGLTLGTEDIEQSSRIVLMPDVGDYADSASYDKVTAWRAENGHPAYDLDEWTFLLKNDLPYITDLFYDGIELIVFTFIPCDAKDFMSGYVDSSISSRCMDVLSLRAGTITAPDGTQQSIFPDAFGLIPQKDYWNEDGTANLAAINRDGGVWLETDYSMPDGGLSKLEPGRYTVSITHSILDGHVAEMSTYGEVAAIEQTFVLDTQKALDSISEVGLPAVAFNGVYRMEIKNYGSEIVKRVENVNFDGFIAAPSVQRRPTGIRVYLDYTYPVTWDDLTREYIWYLGGLNYQVYINGEAAGEPIAVNHRWIDVALMESERKGIDSLVLRPVLHIVQTFQDPQGDDSSEQDILMPQFDIVIPLR